MFALLVNNGPNTKGLNKPWSPTLEEEKLSFYNNYII